MLRIWGNKFQLKEIIKANSRSLDDRAQSSNEQATIFLCPVDEPLCDMLSFTQGVLLNPSVLVTDLTYASLSIPQRVGFQVMSEVAITIFVPKPTLQLYQDLTANLSNVTNIQVNRYHCYSHKSWDDCDQSKKLCLCGKVVS